MGDIGGDFNLFDPGDIFGLHASAPKARKYGAELQQNLSAQIAVAPQLYAAESNQSYGQPAYAQLSASNLNTYLNGSNGQPGYLSLYQNSIAPALTNATINSNNALGTATRSGTLSDLQSLGPQYASALRNLSPDTASLYSKLAQQAGEGLSAGTGLTADQQRNLNNSVRNAQSARGVSFGPAASYAEVLANSDYGNNLLQQRQNFAGQVAGMGNSLYMQPLLNFFNPINNPVPGMSGFSPAYQGSPLFSPESQYAGDINNQRYQTQASINAGNAANNAALTSSIFGAAGSAGKAMA